MIMINHIKVLCILIPKKNYIAKINVPSVTTCVYLFSIHVFQRKSVSETKKNKTQIDWKKQKKALGTSLVQDKTMITKIKFTLYKFPLRGIVHIQFLITTFIYHLPTSTS